MNSEKLAKLQEVAKATVLSQINGNREHGWGLDDSLSVIESVIAEDCSLAGDASKEVPSEEAIALVRQFIVPSAFRQTIEGVLLAEPEKKEKKVTVKLSFK